MQKAKEVWLVNNHMYKEVFIIPETVHQVFMKALVIRHCLLQ